MDDVFSMIFVLQPLSVSLCACSHPSLNQESKSSGLDVLDLKLRADGDASAANGGTVEIVRRRRTQVSFNVVVG